MGLSVNTNIAAMDAYRNLTNTQTSLAGSLQKLSSGLRINSAADDAAGLAISQGLTSQIGGLTVAGRNAQDGISVVQTAEGALTESQAILQRMRDLAVQSANDSNDANSRLAITTETTALTAELDRIASSTTFNNINILNGTFKNKNIQVGYAAGDQIAVGITSGGVVSAATAKFANGAASSTAAAAVFTQGAVVTTTAALTVSASAVVIAGKLNADANFAAGYVASIDGTTGGLTITSTTNNASAVVVSGAGLAGANVAAAQGVSALAGFSSTDLGVNVATFDTGAHATTAIGLIDTAINAVSLSRAGLGALQNRFQHTINNINVTVENLSASKSRITDTDMASEMVKFTRDQILSQAGTAMLAQANKIPQGVLQLLQ
jgi:flagellin